MKHHLRLRSILPIMTTALAVFVGVSWAPRATQVSAHPALESPSAEPQFAVVGPPPPPRSVIEAPHSAQADSDDLYNSPFIGTWLTTVTPDGPDAPPPFPQLLTFNSGGTAMQSATGPPIPALGNPGHGAWKRLNRRQIAATFYQFTFDETLQRNGSLKLSLVATLNERTQVISTVDKAVIFDLDGNEIVALSGIETGRRVAIEVIR